MMKISTTHFVLQGNSDYKDLAPVFPDILRTLLKEIDQVPEEEEIMQMFIDLNVADLERNRKPEGYNRKGKIRLIFPIDRKEFYIKTYNKPSDLTKVSENIKEMLTSAGIKYLVTLNDNVDY
jgi:hypothetical protein